ncbi:uncharacterized protein LOC116953395 isoform X2 [Petromyzon marinus]|uniref:uncharacterized protein LOC116953395 isoform X2 n=1 Tax=Petromyzon marinus TaxID=7757 RepID=UPI003F6E744B
MSMWKAPTNSVFEPRSYDNRESLARKFAAWQNCLRSNGEGEDDEDISATETQRPSSYDVPASERAAAYGLYGETTLEDDPPGPGSRFDKSHRSSGRLYSEHSGLNGARFAGEKLLPLHPAWDERGVSTHVGHSRTAPSAVDTETLPFRKSGIVEIPTHLPLDSSASAKNKTPSHAIDSDYEQRLSQGHAGERSVRTSWTRTLAPRVPESFEQLLNSQFENALSKFSSLVPLEPRGFPLRGSSSPVETERAAYRTLDGSSDGMSLIAGECTARRWDYEMPSAGDTVSALLEFGIVQALPRVTALERHLTEEESLNSNSPAVLRRDIDDLRAQVEELRVASEGLVASLSRAEGEISALRRELQRRDLRADEVARENRALREQADRLQGGRQAGTQPGPHELALLQRFASQGTEVHTNPDFSAWDGALLPPEPRSALACASPASAASSELTDELLRGFEVTEGGAEAGPRRADAASFADSSARAEYLVSVPLPAIRLPGSEVTRVLPLAQSRARSADNVSSSSSSAAPRGCPARSESVSTLAGSASSRFNTPLSASRFTGDASCRGRPFAPRSASDLRVGHRVKFTRSGGRVAHGTVKYVGCLPGREGSYLGVEIEGEAEPNRHDGEYDGRRYFRCKINRGIFITCSRVIMAWE